MNKTLHNLNKLIDQVTVPDELDLVIKEAIKKEKKPQSPNKGRVKQKQTLKKSSLLAASLLILFCLTVNLNSVFAKEIYKIPIVGQFAKLITIRQYSFENETSKGNVTIPEVVITENLALEDQINTLVQQKISDILEEQAILDAEYKEAYLATGGTEESYHKIETEVDYRLNYVSNEMISFVIWKYQTLASAYNEEYYYNYNVSTGEQMTLKDVMGEDYEERIKEIVEKEIIARMEKDPTLNYNLDWFKELEITEDRNYYINNQGDIIIVFAKYEIASGAMGKQEFKVGSIIEE